MVIVVKQQFMEWLLQVAVLAGVQHLLCLLLELWAALVVEETLMALRQEQAQQAVLVIQAHLRLLLGNLVP
jgi:uncharacterized membrane protein YwzB